MTELVQDLQAWVDGLPAVVQFLALFLIGALPATESDAAAVIGVAVGSAWPLAVLAGTAGTALSSTVAVALGARWAGDREPSERYARVLDRVQRWGLLPAMLLSGLVMSISLNALVLTAAGMNRAAVLTSAVLSAAVNALIAALVVLGVIRLVWG